jgi:hypothetical protein
MRRELYSTTPIRKAKLLKPRTRRTGRKVSPWNAMVVAAHAILQAEAAILKSFSTRTTAADMARIHNDY